MDPERETPLSQSQLPEYMEAMVLEGVGRLVMRRVRVPRPGPGQVLVRVRACGVCRTDLHQLEGDLDGAVYPVIPGHEVVGQVVLRGEGVRGLDDGEVVGVPWLGNSCGSCRFCLSGRENLCDNGEFTGFSLNGGYAEFMVANGDYCLKLPSGYQGPEAAPLLCAGLIGHRSLVMAGRGARIGLYGFGAAAHLVCQEAVWSGRRVFAFTRPGDLVKQAFARELGAEWAGGSDQAPPEPMDAAIIFAPAGHLVVNALKSLDKGGKVVCAGIQMSDIPSFPYHLLWQERRVVSVANLTRRDGEEYMELVARMRPRTWITTYSLGDASKALEDLSQGRIRGAAVLVPI